MVRFSRVLNLALITLVASVATACTLGKNYQRPSIQAPSTYRSASGQPTPASLADLQWFELFRDDTLNGLLKRHERVARFQPLGPDRIAWHAQSREGAIGRYFDQLLSPAAGN